jgi:hypothetical protein
MTMRVAGSEQVYQQALRVVRGKFGSIATVKFTFRALHGAPQNSKGDLRFPALLISER